MGILYETNPFLKKCSLEGGVHYREVSLYECVKLQTCTTYYIFYIAHNSQLGNLKEKIFKIA